MHFVKRLEQLVAVCKYAQLCSCKVPPVPPVPPAEITLPTAATPPRSAASFSSYLSAFGDMKQLTVRQRRHRIRQQQQPHFRLGRCRHGLATLDISLPGPVDVDFTLAGLAAAIALGGVVEDGAERSHRVDRRQRRLERAVPSRWLGQSDKASRRVAIVAMSRRRRRGSALHQGRPRLARRARPPRRASRRPASPGSARRGPRWPPLASARR